MPKPDTAVDLPDGLGYPQTTETPMTFAFAEFKHAAAPYFWGLLACGGASPGTD